MRALKYWIVGACGTALISACSGNSGVVAFQARPGEHFSMKQTANPGGSLSDLASQITTDTLLRYRGAKLLKAAPFAPCPGEAGEQTFSVPRTGGAALLHVAFTQWNDNEKIATYERPAKAADDPAAMDALRRSVCTNPLG